jgi:hypothetical protein
MPKRTKGDPVDQYLFDGMVERIRPLTSSRRQPAIAIRPPFFSEIGRSASVPLIPKTVVEQTSKANVVREHGGITSPLTQVDLLLFVVAFGALCVLLADNVYSLGVLEKLVQPYVLRTPDPSFLGFVRGSIAMTSSVFLLFRARHFHLARSQQLVVCLFTVFAIITVSVAISFEHTEIRSAVKQTH